jgi:uncharacterized iron-regulated membrane protein
VVRTRKNSNSIPINDDESMRLAAASIAAAAALLLSLLLSLSIFLIWSCRAPRAPLSVAVREPFGR